MINYFVHIKQTAYKLKIGPLAYSRGPMRIESNRGLNHLRKHICDRFGLETMNLTGVSIVKTHTCNPLYVLYFKNTLHVIHEIHFHHRYE